MQILIQSTSVKCANNNNNNKGKKNLKVEEEIKKAICQIKNCTPRVFPQVPFLHILFQHSLNCNKFDFITECIALSISLTLPISPYLPLFHSFSKWKCKTKNRTRSVVKIVYWLLASTKNNWKAKKEKNAKPHAKSNRRTSIVRVPFMCGQLVVPSGRRVNKMLMARELMPNSSYYMYSMCSLPI